MTTSPPSREDPRHRNEFPESGSLVEFIGNYAQNYANALKSVDSDALDRAIALVSEAAQNNRKIYSIGNGGSAAISDHLCCDFTKGTQCEGHSTVAAHSLNANVALYSAIANDFGFEEVFERQVTYFGAEGDVLIAISSSGNSENVLKAVACAKAKGMATIGMSGFSGGRLAEAADVSLYAAAQNYGVVEDCHQSLMHIIAQVIAQRRDGAIKW